MISAVVEAGWLVAVSVVGMVVMGVQRNSGAVEFVAWGEVVIRGVINFVIYFSYAFFLQPIYIQILQRLNLIFVISFVFTRFHLLLYFFLIFQFLKALLIFLTIISLILFLTLIYLLNM